MNIIKIYEKYRIPYHLQMHMLKVTACCMLIIDNLKENVEINREKLIRIALLHDMGNMAKMSDEQIEDPEFATIRNKYISMYGKDDHKINLSTDGITKVDQLLSDKKYKVEFLTDVEGYINEVIITENGANTGTSQTPNQTPSGTSDLHAAIFNAKFNNYIGNITGSKINDLLRIATESVTNDPSHPITINSNTITDLSEIMPTETYMITPAYDSAGYINTLNIDKIM